MGESGQNGERRIAGPRLIAIVGPFQSGKTSLLESLLVRAGGAARQGSVRDGTSVGDSSPEARSHAMSVEPNVASVDYMGDRFTFVDCPGSVEFIHDMRFVLPVCDAAVVVCEADSRKTPALQVILRELEELGVPRIVFLNKVDLAGGQRARGARDAAARFARAAAAATDADLRERRRHRLRRSRARARVRLSRVGALRGGGDAGRPRRRREAGALQHARAARRLRRRADGAAHQRHRAAARPRVRRSRQRIARRPCRAAADRLGDRRPRRDPAVEGAAPRGAGRRPDPRPARRRGRRPCACPGAAHRPHRPRRQAVAGAGAARRVSRRRGGGRLARQRGAHRRRRAADRRGDRQAGQGRGGRHRRLRPARELPHRRPLQRQQEAARGRDNRAAARPTPRRSPSSPRTARTRSGSRRRWPSCARRIPRSPMSRTRNRPSSSCSARARCTSG